MKEISYKPSVIGAQNTTKHNRHLASSKPTWKPNIAYSSFARIETNRATVVTSHSQLLLVFPPALDTPPTSCSLEPDHYHLSPVYPRVLLPDPWIAGLSRPALFKLASLYEPFYLGRVTLPWKGSLCLDTPPMTPHTRHLMSNPRLVSRRVSEHSLPFDPSTGIFRPFLSTSISYLHRVVSLPLLLLAVSHGPRPSSQVFSRDGFQYNISLITAAYRRGFGGIIWVFAILSQHAGSTFLSALQR